MERQSHTLAFLPHNGQGKRWHLPPLISAQVFASFPEYPKVVMQLLHNRGVEGQKAVDEFFNPDYGEDVHDPYLFADMEKAVARIFQAIDRQEKIIVYGDYDADGVCGSTVLFETIAALGGKAQVHIPDRFSEGYGLNEGAIAEIIKNKEVSLVITVDCGASDVDEVALLATKQKDVIIVDHHLVPPEAPEAFAMLNPKREGETYPFKYLCATGVAFKLASALLQSKRARQAGIKEGFEKWLLDVVAIGSVADMVPLLGENRTLVKYGLVVVKKTIRPGLKELLRMQPVRMTNESGNIRDGMGPNVTAETIAFTLAPRINAASRMAHATASFELLVTKDGRQAQELAEKLEELNNDRRKAIDQIMRETVALVDGEPILFMGRDEWRIGVVGLAAGRLTEKYGKPSFVYGKIGNVFRGSCRGVGGFNVVAAMRHCEEREKDLFVSYGGHPRAGGFTVSEEKIARFKELLLAYGTQVLDTDMLHPVLDIDAQVEAGDINWELFDWLSKFEPYGEGNKKSVFLLSGAEIASVRAVGEKEDHLKITLRAQFTNGSIKYFNCIGFKLSDRMPHAGVGGKVDVAFELEANTWNGTRELQLKLKDIRKSENG